MGKSGKKKSTTSNTDSSLQTKFTSMSGDDAYNFSLNPGNVDTTDLNDNTLQKVVAALNMHEKPIVLQDDVWDSQFTTNALDGVYLYRGVHDTMSKSGKEIIDQIKFGDKTFIGDGVHGDGIYFTTNYDYANMYARYDQSNMAQAYIDKSKARVITERDLNTMRYADTTSARYMDRATYALYKGYNVIHVPGGNADGSNGVVGQGHSYRTATGRKRKRGEDYYVPLTRSVLVIRDNVKR